VPYWAVVRLEPQRERLALHCLGLAGYETYFPRLREKRISHGRKIEVRPPLFPGYAFVAIELQWHTARWSAGVIGLIMDGFRPAKVADSVMQIFVRVNAAVWSSCRGARGSRLASRCVF